MRIGIYGGSVRPGGGLTVLKQLVEAAACLKDTNVYVYTGAQDCSDGLADLFASLENVEEIRFYPGVNAGIRYAISKLYFLNESKRKNLDILISINYFIPASCETVVYHLNLLSFMRGENDSFGMKIKRFDARLACRFADKNVFESRYLQDQAAKIVNIKNSRIMYVGVDPQFDCGSIQHSAYEGSSDKNDDVTIAVVSSPSPHKDNSTCLRALSKLISKHSEVNWRMVFVGGLSESGWDGVKSEASKLGLSGFVSFSGPLNKKELSRLLNQSLCLMNASLIESFCMVAVEAMKSCCPVIVTNATSMPESVGDAGIIVGQKDADAFAGTVELLYERKDLRNDYVDKGLAWANRFTQSEFNKNFQVILND